MKKPDWIEQLEEMEREVGIKPDIDPRPTAFHISHDLPFSFGFRAADDETKTELRKPEPEPPCTNPDGHMFEERPTVLLSYPRQHVWACIHCPVVRHVAEKLPEPRRMRDPK